jgi:hypothetical protein
MFVKPIQVFRLVEPATLFLQRNYQFNGAGGQETFFGMRLRMRIALDLPEQDIPEQLNELSQPGAGNAVQLQHLVRA